MTRLCVLLCGLLWAMAAITASAASNSPDDEAVLRELKQVLWPKAYREQDSKLLDRILEDSFQMIDGDGVWTGKSYELKWVAENKVSYDSFKYDVLRLDIYGGDTAIVAGKGVITGKDKEEAYTAEYFSTNVLIKQAGVWRAVASHVSGYQRK